jgi:hypothetical protein
VVPASELIITDFDGSPDYEGVEMEAGATARILSVQVSVSADSVGAFTLAMRQFSAEDPDHTSFWLTKDADNPTVYLNEVAEPQMLKLATIHVASESSLPGDFNKDLVVDAADYTVWRDGLLNGFDPEQYGIWKQHFGESPIGSTNGVEVPEWNCLGLVLIGIALSAVARMRRPWW